MLWDKTPSRSNPRQQETRSADQRRPDGKTSQAAGAGEMVGGGDSGSPCRRRIVIGWRMRSILGDPGRTCRPTIKRMGHGRHYEKRDPHKSIECTASCAKRISRWSRRFRPRSGSTSAACRAGQESIEHSCVWWRVTTSITYCKSNAFGSKKVAAFSKEKSCPSKNSRTIEARPRPRRWRLFARTGKARLGASGPFTPEVAIIYPTALREMHVEMREAGAEVLQALTFYASRDKLATSASRIGWRTSIAAAVRVAKEVAGDQCWSRQPESDLDVRAEEPDRRRPRPSDLRRTIESAVRRRH